MIPPNTTYSAILLAAGLACFVVSIIIWQLRREATGARSLFAFMVALSWWSITYGIFWADAPAPNPYFWLDMTLAGAFAAPTCLLFFSFEIANMSWWLRRPIILAFSLEPVLVFLIMLTDRWHNLFLGGKRELNRVMIQDGGPVSWANVYYSYILILAALILIIVAYRRSAGYYRKQAATIIVAILLPWIANALFLSGIGFLKDADLTPFMFSITALIMAYALWRYRLLDVVPIARNVVVEKMNEGVIVLDAQDRITDINPAAVKMLNVTNAQVIGKPAKEALAPWAGLAEKYLGVKENIMDEFMVGEGETQQWYEIRLSNLTDTRNQAIGRVAILHDVTQQKKDKEDLVIARNQALEASYTKSAFLANMSHETRTPLGAIIGFSRLIKRKSENLLPEKQLENLDKVIASSDHLLGLINDILDFSKIEAGKLTIEEQTFDIRECVASSVDLLAMRATDKKIHLRSNVDENVPQRIVSDSLRLRQILVNLLSNAVKFTNEGGVDLDIILERSEGDTASLHFSVKDSGIGIEEKDQKRLFQSFSQVDSSTTRKYGGTGLGLVISKRLSELMGGMMWVESEPGMGSTFHFTIRARVD